HGRRLCVDLVTATMLVVPVGDAGAAVPTIESRYDEGARKLDAKEYRAAIEIFHEVLDAAGDTKFGWKSLAGLGWAYEHLGNEPYAAEFYERFLAAGREHLTHGGAIDKDWRKPVRVFSKHLTRLQ